MVYTTGSSSSGSSRRGSSPLSEPLQKSDLHYLWFVNGVPLGDSTVGTITIDERGYAGRYTAPRCSPPGNPVSIAVQIRSDRFYPVAVWLISNIRIISREWKLTVDPIFTLSCLDAGNFDVSDVVTWDGPQEVDFRLNDDFVFFNSEIVLAKPKSHDWHGCRICADGTTSTVENRGSDSPLEMRLWAEWNREADAMALNLNVIYNGPTDLFTICQAGKPESLVVLDRFAVSDTDNIPPGLRWTFQTRPAYREGIVYIKFSLKDICH